MKKLIERIQFVFFVFGFFGGRGGGVVVNGINF